MEPLTFFCYCNPFFWATLSMFALIGGSITLVSHKMRRYRWLNVTFVILFGLGRFMIPLPCCVQPRFDLGPFQFYLGALILVAGLVMMSAMFLIDPWPKPCAELKLVTRGLFSIVRNPMYLGEVLWTLGWALMWGSTIGILLLPLWWAGMLLFVMLEEEDLERCLGEPYCAYRGRVRGRILPWLPF